MDSRTIPYLRQLLKLESSLYQQKKYIESLQQQLQKVRNPILQESISLHSEDEKWDSIAGSMVFYKYFVPLGAGAGLFFAIDTYGVSWIKGLISGGIISAVIVTAFLTLKLKTLKNDNEARTEENIIIAQNNSEHIRRCEAQAQFILKEIEQAKEMAKESQKYLDECYNKLSEQGILYSKYKGMVPVSMFLEYLESGQCDELEGFHGAYNLYESQLKQKIIIGQLDVALENLNSIKNNQHVLAKTLTGAIRSIDQLEIASKRQMFALQEIGSSTEAMAYYSEISAENTEALKMFKILS